tara:strand:+ start:3601 stop:3849 length:249 start_codon:yes stop_codon:yes gene_type:complete
MKTVSNKDGGIIKMICEKSGTLAQFTMYHGWDVVSEGREIGEGLTYAEALAVVRAMTALADAAAMDLSALMTEPIKTKGRES